MPDHIHAFIGLRPSMAISDLARDIKNNLSNFINEKKIVRGKFAWQEGYSVFSYSHSQIGNVYDYILNQEEHHRKKTFKEEYIDFLKKNLKLNTIKNIYLIGLNNNTTPSGFSDYCIHIYYNHYTPSGFTFGRYVISNILY